MFLHDAHPFKKQKQSAVNSIVHKWLAAWQSQVNVSEMCNHFLWCNSQGAVVAKISLNTAKDVFISKFTPLSAYGNLPR